MVQTTLDSFKLSATNSTSWQNDEVPKSKNKRNRESPNTSDIRQGKRPATVHSFTVPTSNMFSPLLSNDAALNNPPEDDQNDLAKEIIPKPQPIFVTGVRSIQELKTSLETVSKFYTLTTMKSGHTVKIMPTDVANYRVIREHLLAKDIKHYTYQLKHEKAYRVILRGMHSSENTNDIKQDIELHGHQVRNIANARHRTTKEPLPLFYIDLEPSPNNRTIFDIKHLNHTIVKFEPPYKKREILQCKRCQRFGHTKNLCNRPFRCVKCGLDHPTSECTKNIDSPAVCINCNGSHPASYRGCTTYKEYKQRIYAPNRRKEIPGQSNPTTQFKLQHNPDGTPALYNSDGAAMPTYAERANPNAAKPNLHSTNDQIHNQTNTQDNLLSSMDQVLSRFEKSLERMLDKMFDRMFDLIKSIACNK